MTGPEGVVFTHEIWSSHTQTQFLPPFLWMNRRFQSKSQVGRLKLPFLLATFKVVAGLQLVGVLVFLLCSQNNKIPIPQIIENFWNKTDFGFLHFRPSFSDTAWPTVLLLLLWNLLRKNLRCVFPQLCQSLTPGIFYI